MHTFEWNIELIKQKIGSKRELEMMDMDGDSALSFACSCNHSESTSLIEDILNTGVDINLKHGRFMDTPLMIVCRRGNLEKVDLLLKRGADANMPSSSGSTPLHIASFRAFRGIMKRLIAHEADISKQNGDGQTPAMLAAQSGDVEALSMLIDAGVDINVQDAEDYTAIVYALLSREHELTTYLLKKKPDINPVLSHERMTSFLDFHHELRNYIEKNMHTLTPDNLKRWKAYRIKALFA